MCEKRLCLFSWQSINLAFWVRRMLLTETGEWLPADKDYYGNKRLELAGGVSLVNLILTQCIIINPDYQIIILQFN